MSGYTIVGKRIPARDAVLKVTGQAKYGNDLILPQLLYGTILRSPYPHARILNIETSKAERVVGVKAVITGKDTAGMATKAAPYGHKQYQEMFAVDKVRFMGEPLAALAAVDEEVAAEALELIQVEYEELPAVSDPEEAMKPGAPLVHDYAPNNIMIEKVLEYGDVEEGFKASDYVREDKFVTQRVTHGFIEPHVVIARAEASGQVTIWASKMAGVSRLRAAMVNMLDLTEGDVRVIRPYVGGSFGGKNFVMAHDLAAALLSIKSGRPVKVTLSREEVFYHLCRSPIVINLKTGIKKDGSLMAIAGTVIGDVGAYFGHGPTVPGRVGQHLSIPYRVPHLKYRSYWVLTNSPVAGPQRATVVPQVRFAMDSQIDMLAEAIGMDPLALRLRNSMGPGEGSPEVRFRSCGLKECLEKVAELIQWQKRRKTPGNRGVGIGVGAFKSGALLTTPGFKMPYQPPWQVEARLHEGGRVTVHTHTRDAGQGGDTALCQIAAEELGISLKDVAIFSRDTTTLPADRIGESNTEVYGGGNATQGAARDLKRQIFEVVADKLECNPQDLEAKDGHIFVKGSPARGISFPEAALAVFAARGATAGRGSWAPVPGAPETFSFHAYAAEVEVDPETGKAKVIKMAGAYDCGFAVNPLLLEGQIQGGIGMGVGYAMSEELMKDKEGHSLTPGFLDYRMPTALDISEIEPILVEPMDLEEGAYGVKEGAEGTEIATSPAIANAIYNAIGVRITSLPITPEKVLRALEDSPRP